MAKTDPYREFLKQEFNALFDEMELTPKQHRFMKSRWLDQMLWLDKKAGECRDNYYRLRLTAIVLGVLVPVIIGVDFGSEEQNRIKRYLTIGLSSVVAVSAAVEEFFHYGERWYHYRRTAESLKTQVWQYSSLTGLYKSFADHQAAFKSFATQIEEIIQKDVEVYVTQVAKTESDEEKEENNDGVKTANTPAKIMPSAETNALPTAHNEEAETV